MLQPLQLDHLEILTKYCDFFPVMWIRIRSDQHHFAGSGSVSTFKKCKTIFLSIKFQYAVQNTENNYNYDTVRKDNWNWCE
jgi:hypothetical protein